MNCPKCGGKMFLEALPPSDQYIRKYVGYYEYNCLYCGKTVYQTENPPESIKKERKVQIRKFISGMEA